MVVQDRARQTQGNVTYHHMVVAVSRCVKVTLPRHAKGGSVVDRTDPKYCSALERHCAVVPNYSLCHSH